MLFHMTTPSVLAGNVSQSDFVFCEYDASS